MAKSTLSDLPTLTEWLKAHPGEHLLPAATVAREAGIKEATLRAIHWRKPRPTKGNTTNDQQD